MSRPSCRAAVSEFGGETVDSDPVDAAVTDESHGASDDIAARVPFG
jgi:hypothetical protein